MVAHFASETVLPQDPLKGGLHNGNYAFAEASLGSSLLNEAAVLHEDQDLEHIAFHCK